jgi:phosphatidylinositol kinase/protein kinase (PI-3  family)
MKRERSPEKFPFRLTRMLVKAMEACGIEGVYRHTCNIVMRVLRDNKEYDIIFIFNFKIITRCFGFICI